MFEVTVLTFDDALLNTYEVAFPILEKYGVKATLFVPTCIINTNIRVRSDKAPHMSLDQMSELSDAGWEVGSHSHSHPRFDLISYDAAVRELYISKTLLEAQGFDVQSFAFPYGHGYYLQDQVYLALEFYNNVRTLHDQASASTYEGMITGVNLDSYPPSREKKADVYVLHLVRDPEGFEKWISTLNGVVLLKELKNYVR